MEKMDVFATFLVHRKNYAKFSFIIMLTFLRLLDIVLFVLEKKNIKRY